MIFLKIIIMMKKLIKLNIESNIKLNDIYKKYYNREFVIDILEILYRKEINKLIK